MKTKEEELAFLQACGAKLSELTDGKLLGTALVMLFPNEDGTARIHAVSNLEPRKCQELLELYVGQAAGTNRRRESVWLLLRHTQVDQVTTTWPARAFSTKAAAHAEWERQCSKPGMGSKEAWSVEEMEVDSAD